MDPIRKIPKKITKKFVNKDNIFIERLGFTIGHWGVDPGIVSIITQKFSFYFNKKAARQLKLQYSVYIFQIM